MPSIVHNPITGLTAGTKLPPIATKPKIEIELTDKLISDVDTLASITLASITARRGQKSVSHMSNAKIFIDLDGNGLDDTIASQTHGGDAEEASAMDQKRKSSVVAAANSELAGMVGSKLPDKHVAPGQNEGPVQPPTTTRIGTGNGNGNGNGGDQDIASGIKHNNTKVHAAWGE